MEKTFIQYLVAFASFRYRQLISVSYSIRGQVKCQSCELCRYSSEDSRPRRRRSSLNRLPTFFMSNPDLQSHNLQLIRDALNSYAEQMKIDLKDNPFAEELKGCNSPEAILQLLEKNRDDFKGYRDKNRKFVDCLKPVVKFVHAFSEILGEATSLVSAERS